MAFGNGAPDIFSSIASVTSAKRPKASLAISELLGGGIFVSSVVVALIIFVATRKQDFKLNKFTFLRDTLFYLVALTWLAFIVLFNKKLFIWEPSVYLCIYFAYALVVILSGRYFKRRASRKTRPAATSIAELRVENADQKTNGNGHLKPPLSNGIQPPIERAPAGTSTSPLVRNGSIVSYSSLGSTSRRSSGAHSATGSVVRRESVDYNHWALPTAHRTRHMTVLEPRRTSHGLITPKVVVDLAEETAIQSPGAQEGMFLEHGKFFEAETEEEIEVPEINPEEPIPGISANDLLPITAERSRSMAELIGLEGGLREQLRHTLFCLNPLDLDDFRDKSKWNLILTGLTIPCVFFFKLTIPLAGDHWCKYKAVLHSITAPITILFAFQLYDIQLFDGPSLWMLALGLSAVLAFLLIAFTDAKRPPRFYRKVTSSVGFVASTAWIYAIAAEVVDVVLMIGIISTISFDILGLTVIAWSNSLGDLIADLAVARQGFPRMAIAAAVAGPLFSWFQARKAF